jgi:hypothetical protein
VILLTSSECDLVPSHLITTQLSVGIGILMQEQIVNQKHQPPPSGPSEGYGSLKGGKKQAKATHGLSTTTRFIPLAGVPMFGRPKQAAEALRQRTSALPWLPRTYLPNASAQPPSPW